MTESNETLVRNLMKTDVATVLAQDSVRDALMLMHKTGLSCLVVDLEDRSRGVGILTQKDILSVLIDPEENVKNVLVADIMTAPAVSVSPDFGIPTCVQLMRMLGVRRMPVIENGKLIGIISFADVFEYAIRAVL